MRDYAKVGPQFWIGPTGKKIKASGAEATIVAMYLITSPHSNMLGLYYLPTLYIAHETGLGLDGAAKGMKLCADAGFCSYDEATEMVWVHEMASYQIANELKEDDRRCRGVQNDYDALPANAFLGAFFDKYAKRFHMTLRRAPKPAESPLQAPSMPLASQEQEQEQDQDISSLRSDAPSCADDDPKKVLYRLGAETLGARSGGIVAKLVRATSGFAEALFLLRQAVADIDTVDGRRAYLMRIVNDRERERAEPSMLADCDAF